MTAPTHMAFGVLWAAAADAGYLGATACALGSLLPDIDHPNSSLGRILFFVSAPLNDRFGHRGVIHGLILWVPLLLFSAAFGFTLMKWMILGALSHIIIDTYTVSGVRALLPFSKRSLVCFKKDWRIVTGSVHEIFVFVGIFVLISAFHYGHSLGSPRKFINLLVKSPTITLEEYTRAGLGTATARGTFRWADGRTRKAEWKVVGIEKGKLVYWDGSRLIRARHGEFIRSSLVEHGQVWPQVSVEGFSEVAEASFWFDGEEWHHALAGDTVFGTVKTVSGGMPALRIGNGLPSGR